MIITKQKVEKRRSQHPGSGLFEVTVLSPNLASADPPEGWVKGLCLRD